METEGNRMNVRLLDIEGVRWRDHDDLVLIDVRSPGEFRSGHIPGAINCPLLNDDERAEVGTVYKQKGRDEAVQLGFRLVGGKFADYVREAKGIAGERGVVVYCWRGGMRSDIMAWVFNLAGIRTSKIEGGYKAWRRYCINLFGIPRKIVLLSGPTGAGKTEVLRQIAHNGGCVVDLEHLAMHRGSSFGGLGMEAQPTQAQFENELGWELAGHDPDQNLWVEDESRFIGRVRIPDDFFRQMKNASECVLNVSRELRIRRILEEYGGYPREELAARTAAIQRRMGPEQCTKALNALYGGDLLSWAESLLEYYDKTYFHTVKERRKSGNAIILHQEDVDGSLPSGELARRLTERAFHHVQQRFNE